MFNRFCGFTGTTLALATDFSATLFVVLFSALFREPFCIGVVFLGCSDPDCGLLEREDELSESLDVEESVPLLEELEEELSVVLPEELSVELCPPIYKMFPS